MTSLAMGCAVTLLIVCGVLLWLMRKDTKENGAYEQREEYDDHLARQVLEANDIRDRLESDPDYRQRVSDRFTRR